MTRAGASAAPGNGHRGRLVDGPMRWLLFLTTLTLAACSSDREPTTRPATSAPEHTVPAEVRPGARLDRILAPRDDDAAFLAGLRAPRLVTTEAVPDRRADSVRTWRYDGLTIESYKVAGGPTRIRRVAVNDGSYGTSDGLSVGETRATLEAVLGASVRESGREATYRPTAGLAPTTVEVTYEPDEDGAERASEIVWLPTVG